MSVIPSDILREILLRLPGDSLLRFRDVCRAWRRIIDDPSFVRSHSINQNSNCSSLLIRDYKGGCLYSLSLETLNHEDRTIELAPIKQLISRGVPRMYALPYAVCNGLLLIYDFDPKRNFVIWNPLNRDFHMLPVPDLKLISESGYKLDWFVSWSLGYDHASDDYKVVKIFRFVRIDKLRHGNELVFKTLVYSLKLGVWRVGKDFPCDISTGKGVYLNGSVYWKSRENEIIMFDVGTEDYTLLQGPPLPARYSCERLEVMGGCLVFSCYDDSITSLEGWTMGGENSWVKLFWVRPLRKYLKPVAYLKKKNLVVLQESEETLFLFDLESNSVSMFGLQDMPKVSAMQFCPGSLFRLNDSGGAAAAGVKRKRAQKSGLNWTALMLRGSAQKDGGFSIRQEEAEEGAETKQEAGKRREWIPRRNDQLNRKWNAVPNTLPGRRKQGNLTSNNLNNRTSNCRQRFYGLSLRKISNLGVLHSDFPPLMNFLFLHYKSLSLTILKHFVKSFDSNMKL